MNSFGYPPPNDPGLGPPGGLASAVVDASQAGGSSDSVVYASKYFNLVGLVYASKTAAWQTLENNLPANGGIRQLPPGVHIIDNVQISTPGEVRGVAGQTWLVEGASGTAFTCDYAAMRNGSFTLSSICVGESSWAPVGSPARSYATPLINFVNWSGVLTLEKVYARIDNTGTVFRFASSGNIAINNSHLYTWQYGVPFLFEQRSGGSFEADTISFNNTMMYGRYGGIFRTEAGTYTVHWNTSKFVVSGTQTLLDHSLAVDAAAGATTVTLQTGQGASWAIDDSIYLSGDFAIESAARNGNAAEVNRVTGVAGDVLTLSQPLQYAHGTNGNTFTVLARRGGVGLSICSNTGMFKGDQTHFEALSFAIIDHGSVGSEWTNCTHSCSRFYCIAGRVQDLTIGPMRCDGGGGTNHLLELPTWNNAGANTDRYNLWGPWTGVAACTVLDSGTSLTMDLLHTGALMRSKNYIVWDGITGTPRFSYHAGTATPVARRYGYSTNPDQIDLAYGGNVTMQGDLDVGTVGKGVKIKEGANAKQGVATLVAGTVTVANTSVTATSRIQLTVQSLGTVTAPKAIAVTARTAGTSFTITSADATDTSVVAYEIFEPG